MQAAKNIIIDIKKGVLKPIYFLYGEEAFFIDQISSYIEKNILTDTEKGFNQTVLYGRDVTIEQIVSTAKRYPMMAQYQVVIIKEAQELSRSIEKLESYATNPQPTTILVLNYKYKKLDKRKALYKAISKTGVLLESKKLYENQASDWVIRLISSKGHTINPKTVHILVESLGTDLSRLYKEIEKLNIILPPKSNISPSDIEQNIGISKDFNTFELRQAMGEKNIVKAQLIAKHFSQNSKEYPLVVTTSTLYSFFAQLLKYHGLPQKDKSLVAKTLGINPFFVNQYVSAARNYPIKRVSVILRLLKNLDAQSKGVNNASISQGDLLKEFITKAMG